jgi:hypothetical protein
MCSVTWRIVSADVIVTTAAVVCTVTQCCVPLTTLCLWRVHSVIGSILIATTARVSLLLLCMLELLLLLLLVCSQSGSSALWPLNLFYRFDRSQIHTTKISDLFYSCYCANAELLADVQDVQFCNIVEQLADTGVCGAAHAMQFHTQCHISGLTLRCIAPPPLRTPALYSPPLLVPSTAQIAL